SKRRKATISRCGEPYQRLSVPHTTRLGPTWVMSLPRRWAAWSGESMASRHTEPSSAHTLGTLPNALPFSRKRLASQWFSRRLLIRASTLCVVELAMARSEERRVGKEGGWGGGRGRAKKRRKNRWSV